MAPNAGKALQLETDFLAGVEANFESAKGRDFRGTLWQFVRFDDEDRLRALLADQRQYDRERLKGLPANRRVALFGFEKRFWLWKRQTGAAVASVLSSLRHYAAGEDAPPIGLGELTDHVRHLAGEARVPHLIGVCSPTGFTEEARQARLSLKNATVVLIEPDGHGGWRVTPAGENVDPRVLRIFDPEGPKQKAERIRRLIDEHTSDLLTGGLSASSLARRANLSEELVRQGFEGIAAHDPELKLVRREGEFVLFRGAPTARQEKKGMNVIERIRRLFSGDGDAAQQINALAERRALLAQRRDRMYEDIARLEQKESELFAQGKAATSAVPRRRLAAQLAQLRKDIARQNTTAAMLNQQINIISTDIHNLTLIQQGKLAELPDTETLTQHAVEAEEMLETLKSDSDLVGTLEMGMEQSLVSADEAAILREFEEADAPPVKQEPAKAATPPESAVPREASPTKSRSAYQPVEEPPAAPREPRKDREGPEAT